MIHYKKSKVPSLSPPKEGVGVHPVVRWIWVQMNKQRASQQDVSARSGVSASAMRKWRVGVRSPSLREIEAVVNALGGKLVIKMKDDE